MLPDSQRVEASRASPTATIMQSGAILATTTITTTEIENLRTTTATKEANSSLNIKEAGNCEVIKISLQLPSFLG